MKRVNFCFPEQLIEKLKNLAAKTGLTMSEIIRRALDDYFDKYKDK